MAVTREITIAGELRFIRTFFGRRGRPKGEERKTNHRHPTSDKVREMNDRAAERQINIKLAYNFKDGDWHLTLTYGGVPPTAEDAKKHRAKFCRDLTALYRKCGILLKWIAVTEYLSDNRIHHHIVATFGAPFDEIQKIWPYGRIRPVLLNTEGDYRKLGDYLIKETSKHFRAENAVFKRRYSCSRTIEIPETKREDVSFEEIEEPTAPLGWYIDRDSFYRGYNPNTEREYVEYVLKPVNPYRKRKTKADKHWEELPQTRPSPLGHSAWLRDNYEYQLDALDFDMWKSCTDA